MLCLTQLVMFMVFQIGVANREDAKCPLVGKFCNINSHNQVKSCYSCPLFPYWLVLILID